MKLELNYTVQPIQANFDALRKWVISRTVGKDQLLVRDEDIKFAKVERADLRGLREEIEIRRKQLKNEWNKPYFEIEEQIKQITALIDKPILAIDGQIKDYEERKREERKSRLQAEFAKWDFGGLLNFETVLEKTWLNASALEARAVKELKDKCKKIVGDIGVLESIITPQTRTAVLARFFQTLELSSSLAYQQTLLASQKKQEETLGRQEEPEQILPEQEPAPKITEPPMPSPRREEPVYVSALTVRGTKTQFENLRQYAVKIGLDVLKY